MVTPQLTIPSSYRPIGSELRTFHLTDLSPAEQKTRFNEIMAVRADRIDQFATLMRANGRELSSGSGGLVEFGAFMASAFGPNYWEMADLDPIGYSVLLDASLHLGSLVHSEIPSTTWVVAAKGRIGEGQHALVGFAARRHDPYPPLWLVNSFLMRVARGGEKQTVQLSKTMVQVTVPPAPHDEFAVQLERLRQPD